MNAGVLSVKGVNTEGVGVLGVKAFVGRKAFSFCSGGRLKTLNGVLFSSIKGVNAGPRSALPAGMSCCDFALSWVDMGFAFGVGLPWSSVKTSLKGARGILPD